MTCSGPECRGGRRRASRAAVTAVMVGSCAVVLAASLSAPPCAADPPHVSYIFPAGGQRGTRVEVRVGGHYLYQKCGFECDSPTIRGPEQLLRAAQTRWFEGPVIPLPDSQQKEDYPKDQVGALEIAADAPLGVHYWRVTTSQGVTASMPFVVGDFAEVVEEEIDGRPLPTPVDLPVTINGRIFPREDVDLWTFTCRAGEQYVCEVLAQRIGSPLDSRIEVTGPQGNVVASSIDAQGDDSRVLFRAAQSGLHTVRIHDVRFAGLQDYVYRLTISNQPYVRSVYPLGGRRGARVRCELTGSHVPSTAEVPLPAGPPPEEGPGDAAAPAAQPAFWVAPLNLPAGTTNLVRLQVSEFDERLEQEPNQAVTECREVAIPGVANGRVDQPGDEDLWRITGQEGVALRCELHAARLGSPLDSVLRVLDEGGKVLAQNDNGSGATVDSWLNFTPPRTGAYYLSVGDRFASRGGSDFAYRLTVTAAQPDFRVRLAEDVVTLLPGQETKLKAEIERLDGFAGPLKLVAEGLPAGISLKTEQLPAKRPQGDLVFHAAADAAPWNGTVRIRCVGEVAEGVARSRAVLPSRRGEALVAGDGASHSHHLRMTVAVAAPFRFTGTFESRYGARGSTFKRQYRLERNGYEGPLTIQLADRQVRHLQGITAPPIVVPPGQDTFEFAIHLAPWMEVGRTSRTCLMAVADVVGNDGQNHRVSYSSQAQNDQIIVLVDPGQLDIQVRTPTVEAQPGATQAVRLRIGRGGQLADLPVELTLQPAAHIQGVTAPTVLVPPGEEDAELQLQFAAEGQALGPFNMPLTIQALARLAGDPYTATAEVIVAGPASNGHPLEHSGGQ